MPSSECFAIRAAAVIPPTQKAVQKEYAPHPVAEAQAKANVIEARPDSDICRGAQSRKRDTNRSSTQKDAGPHSS